MVNKFWYYVYRVKAVHLFAGIAQLVEQLIRNEQAAGSSPITSSRIKPRISAVLFFLSYKKAAAF